MHWVRLVWRAYAARLAAWPSPKTSAMALVILLFAPALPGRLCAVSFSSASPANTPSSPPILAIRAGVATLRRSRTPYFLQRSSFVSRCAGPCRARVGALSVDATFRSLARKQKVLCRISGSSRVSHLEVRVRSLSYVPRTPVEGRRRPFYFARRHLLAGLGVCFVGYTPAAVQPTTKPRHNRSTRRPLSLLTVVMCNTYALHMCGKLHVRMIMNALAWPSRTIVLKSTCAAGAGFNPAPVVINEQRIVGSRCGPFKAALRMLADPDGGIDVERYISSGWSQARRLRVNRSYSVYGVCCACLRRAVFGRALLWRAIVLVR